MPHEDNPWAKEAEENQSRQRQSDINNMTWKPGEHTIRILPAKKKGGMPFAKYIVHWIPVKTAKNDRPIVHAVDYKCPVCEFVGELWSEIYRLKEEEEMTDKSPEVQKLVKQASKLRGKKTYDMNVIHRDDARTDSGKIKVKRLVAGPTIWKAIIELGNSEKWGNPSSAGKRGYDLTVTVDGEGLKREYTILPDPDRKPLTDDELEAVESAYDLEKLRKFSTAKDILDILKSAKAPLDSVDLQKVKKSLSVDFEKSTNNSDDDDDTTESTDAPSHNDDDDDNDVAAPSNDDSDDDNDGSSDDDNDGSSDDDNDSDDDDDEEDQKKNKQNKKEAAAFSSSDDSGDDSDDDGLTAMDCRGTYDGEDIGCQECDYVGDCKRLQKDFASKAKELDIDIDGMNGEAIEKAIKAKEASKKSGKAGKVGKAGKENSGKKRDLPF